MKLLPEASIYHVFDAEYNGVIMQSADDILFGKKNRLMICLVTLVFTYLYYRAFSFGTVKL